MNSPLVWLIMMNLCTHLNKWFVKIRGIDSYVWLMRYSSKYSYMSESDSRGSVPKPSKDRFRIIDYGRRSVYFLFENSPICYPSESIHLRSHWLDEGSLKVWMEEIIYVHFCCCFVFWKFSWILSILLISMSKFSLIWDNTKQPLSVLI